MNFYYDFFENKFYSYRFSVNSIVVHMNNFIELNYECIKHYNGNHWIVIKDGEMGLIANPYIYGYMSKTHLKGWIIDSLLKCNFCINGGYFPYSIDSYEYPELLRDEIGRFPTLKNGLSIMFRNSMGCRVLIG